MKQLTCEMCGSADMVKQNGMFVCQYCGTKYSIEEAKKLMIEGTVEVAGTVKVDNSALVEKYLMNARRALQKEDWEETEKYYNLVEQNDPTNIEAIFYSSYGKAKSSLIDSDLYKRQAAFKVLTNCISIIDDNYDVEKEEAELPVIQKISTDILRMTKSDYVYNKRVDGYGATTWSDQKETKPLFNALENEFCVSLENIASKYPDDRSDKKIFFYEIMIVHAKNVLQNGQLAYPEKNQKENEIGSYYQKIGELDPSYPIPKEYTSEWKEQAEQVKLEKKIKALKRISIVALILAFLYPLIGLLMGILTFSEARKEGKVIYQKRAKLAIILSSVMMVPFIILYVLFFININQL